MTDERHITCQELIRFLGEYVDGTLPEAQRASFEAHLEACPDCVDYLDTYRRTIQLGRAAKELADDAGEMPEELVQAILSAREG